MITNKVRLSSVVAFFALGLAPLLGCGDSLQPGDYRIYKMAFQTVTKSNGCFAMNTPDSNTKSDSDSTLSSDTWVMTTDTSDNIFLDLGKGTLQLDLGKGTLQGTPTDAGYTFKGEVIDVQFEDNDSTRTKETLTTTTTIDVTIDGKSIGGTATGTVAYRCSTPSATKACPNPLPSDCSTTSKFSGTQVDDVELEYPVK